MCFVKNVSMYENVLLRKYLSDVKLPVDETTNQLNKLGVAFPKNHFITRLQLEKVDEADLFKDIYKPQELIKLSHVMSKYTVVHITMVNDQTYHMILKYNIDLESRLKQVKKDCDYYLEHEEEINKLISDEFTKFLH